MSRARRDRRKRRNVYAPAQRKVSRYLSRRVLDWVWMSQWAPMPLRVDGREYCRRYRARQGRRR